MEVNFKSRAFFAHNVDTIKNLPEECRKITFVELQIREVSDYLLTKDLRKLWEKDAPLVKYINEEFKYRHYVNDSFERPFTRFFGITKQPRSYHKLDCNDILAISQVTTETNDARNIDFIEGNPMLSEKIPNTVLQDTTYTLLNMLGQLLKHKKMSVHALKSEFDSYEKLGFKQTGIWTYKDKIQLLEKEPVE